MEVNNNDDGVNIGNEVDHGDEGDNSDEAGTTGDDVFQV